MKLALVESDILWEDKQGNIKKLADLLCKLSTSGRLPFLIALPEMSFTGFTMNTAYSAETKNEYGEYPTIQAVKRLSKEYSVAVAFGWVKKICDGEAPPAENHYTIVDSLGEIVFDYAKLHPFSYGGEDRYFRGGDRLFVTSMGGFKLGAAVCYDLRFPEIFQIMADRADMIFVPSNWPKKRREHFQVLSRARAIETQCYIAAINRRGEGNGLLYAGDTELVAPNGDIVPPIEVLDIASDRVFLYDVENDVDKIRGEFPVRKDRKNTLYKKLRQEG